MKMKYAVLMCHCDMLRQQHTSCEVTRHFTCYIVTLCRRVNSILISSASSLFSFLISFRIDSSVVFDFLKRLRWYLYIIYFFASTYLLCATSVFSIISCIVSTGITSLSVFSTFPIASSIKSSLTFCELSTSTFAFLMAAVILSALYSTILPSRFCTFTFITPSLYKTLYTVLSLKKNMQKARLYACFMQISNTM